MDPTLQSVERLRAGVNETSNKIEPVPPNKFTKKPSTREECRQELTEVLESIVQSHKDRRKLNGLRWRTAKSIRKLKTRLHSNKSSAPIAEELKNLIKTQNETIKAIEEFDKRKDYLFKRKAELKSLLKILPHKVPFIMPKSLLVQSTQSTCQPPLGTCTDTREAIKIVKPRLRKEMIETEEINDPLGVEEPRMKREKITEAEECNDPLEVEEPRIKKEKIIEVGECNGTLEMIEIEEPKLKGEVFKIEEFNDALVVGEPRVKEENIFDTEECNKDHQEDVEMSVDYTAAETSAPVTENAETAIKSEPLDEEEEEEEEDEEEDADDPPEEALPERAPLRLRCPLISCPYMFSKELEMLKHLNLNHKIRGLALVTKAVKVSPASAAATPPVALPASRGPSLLPLVAPVTVAGLPLASSSCGSSSVTTTTISYSLSTAWSPLVTTTVSNSPVTSLPAAAHFTTLPSGSISAAPVSSPAVLSSSTPDVSAGSSAASSSLPSFLPAPHLVKVTSQGPQNSLPAPLKDLNSYSAAPAKFYFGSQQTLQPPANVPTSPLIEIFNPSDRKLEDFPPYATDDSEMFSISLAMFPQNKRPPIKRKILDLFDCMIQKNIGPDNLVIAYYGEKSDSRSM